MKQIETPMRLFDLVDWQMSKRKKKQTAFRILRDGKTSSCSREEYKEKCDLISYALLHYGVRRGDTIALIAHSRPEWNMIDMGTMQVGAALMPMETTLDAESYLKLMQDANVRILILENSELLNRFKLLLPQMETLKEVFTIDLANIAESFEALLKTGRRFADPEQLQDRRDHITADERCTVAVGPGKDIKVLSHKEMMKQVLKEADNLKGSKEEALSDKPLDDLQERVKNYAFQYLEREIVCRN